MAIHTLDSENYKDLQYNRSLWNQEDTEKIGDLVCNLFPPISRVTSLSENRAFKWLFGKVQVEGEGEVQVIYPYLDSTRDILTLRNVDLSACSMLILKAEPDKKSVFEGWYDSVTKEQLSDQRYLILSESSYLETTGFVAKFSSYENSMGI